MKKDKIEERGGPVGYCRTGSGRNGCKERRDRNRNEDDKGSNARQGGMNTRDAARVNIIILM